MNQILGNFPKEELVEDNETMLSPNNSNEQIRIYIVKDSTANDYLKEALSKIDDPFKNLTVKDVAKDLQLGVPMANELFKREDFPSVNIGKTKTVTLLAYLKWKMERRL